MLFDEPLCVVILDGNSRGALKALVAIEQVKSGIPAFVDPIAVHRPLFPRQRGVRRGGNRDGGRGRQIGSRRDDDGQLRAPLPKRVHAVGR